MISASLIYNIEERLRQDHFDDPSIERISKIIGLVIDQDFPEFGAIDRLRNQFHNRNKDRKALAKEKFGHIPKYSVKSGIDPVEYFKNNYKDFLETGNINANQLHEYDSNLDIYLTRYLKEGTDPNLPRTASSLIDQLSPVPVNASQLQERIRACSVLLGASEPETMRFLHTIHSPSKNATASGRS